MGFSSHISGPLAYHERPGRGPALVLLHGIGSEGRSFAALAPRLPADWRLIAWDAPGYGGSAPLAADWPLAADYAQALGGLLDRLGLGAVLLAGHSLGALVAAAFARAHPARVARLLLASPALGHGQARGAPLGAAAQARLDDLARLGPEGFAAARAARLIHAPETAPELVEKVRASMARIRPEGYGPAVRMLASGRLCDDLAALAVPCDVIVGRADAVTPPEAARRAHGALPAALRGSYTEVPGAGHAIYHQAPAAFAAALVALAAEPAAATGERHG